ncbi:AGAP010356-PA-like protein [Anopheles sinensis]|uniref:AGAP010356-PA-like protein n=1 Tax=Anopheles sinensis TaxID=74873 RepID=A0A084WC86_ANOSI|nr:AGAP010356-PA-like protein [Anopheles sinensis]
MMSALSYQVNMNNFLSLLVGASLVAANSSPNHDISAPSQPTEFSNGVSSFALPAEDRMAIESSTLAHLNYSYVDAEGHLVELGGNESAKYGEGRVLNRTGILVHVSNSVNRSDHTGCSKHWNGTRGQALPERHISWIALIRRGSCNFEDKVKHAFEHGAAGVIIYNDKDDAKLDKMKINDKERNITAVFTTKAMGNELIDIVELRGHEVVMHIIEGSRQFRSMANINRHEFHKACIDPWLLEHRTCPMCKMDILKHYGFVVGSSTTQINAAITEYLNITPPPPPSNTSTITTSSMASIEDPTRIVSWPGQAAGRPSTASATRDNPVESELVLSRNNYSSSLNAGAVGGQLNDIVTIIINIEDYENSTDDNATTSASGTNGVVGGDDNSGMREFCNFSTQHDLPVHSSSASMCSNSRDIGACDSSNTHNSDCSETNSNSHLISKHIANK